MKCKQVQELILTDYFDGRMNKSEEKQLETHLAECIQCREFKSTAKKTVIEPFRNSEREIPGNRVWLKIREEIEKENVVNPFAEFIRRIIAFTVVPKPALAAATIMAVLLVGVIFMKTPTNHQGTEHLNLEDQMDYMAYLIDGSSQSYSGQDQNLGTSIEAYFL